MRRICVFCGANVGDDPRFAEAALEVGSTLAAQGIGVVTGGGRVGLMGLVADAALAGGGEVIGVIPDALLRREVGHEGVTELRIVGSMHERKQLMHDLSDAFLALPGGLGSLEELLESLTWSQLGLHGKPTGVLNVGGYYDPLVAMLDRAVQDGMLAPENRALLLEGPTLEDLMESFESWSPPPVERWIERGQT